MRMTPVLLRKWHHYQYQIETSKTRVRLLAVESILNESQPDCHSPIDIAEGIDSAARATGQNRNQVTLRIESDRLVRA